MDFNWYADRLYRDAGASKASSFSGEQGVTSKMIQIPHIKLRIGAMAFCALMLHVGSAQSQLLPAEVQTALESYSSLSPFAVHLQETVQEHGYDSKVSMDYFRDGDRFSWLYESVFSNGRLNREYRFDGHVVSSSNGVNDASWYDIEKLKKSQPTASNFEVAYFDAAGLYYPKQHDRLQNGSLRSAILELLAVGGEFVSCERMDLENEETVKIEIDAENPAWSGMMAHCQKNAEYESASLKNKNISKDEFDAKMALLNAITLNMPQRLRFHYYLSINNKFAVRKHERITLTGQVVASFSNENFEQVSNTSIRLPRKVSARLFESTLKQYSYSIAKLPVTLKEISVTDFSLDSRPEGQFVLDRTKVAPGATIIDAVTAGMQRDDGSVITYKMPASPDSLDQAVALAKGRYDMTNSSGRTVLFAVNGLLVFVICAFFFLRRCRR